MRKWRKLWKNISISDKVAALSYEARWLYVLLVLYQDDNGNCQYSRSKMKSIVAGSTEWSTNDIQRFLTELEGQILIVVNDTYISIIGGKEKNGNLYNDREALVYDIAEITSVNNEKQVSLKNLKPKNLKNLKLNRGNENEENRFRKINTESKFRDNG